MNPVHYGYRVGIVFLMAGLLLLFSESCKQELPDNPYDDVDYGQDTVSIQEPDPASIVGIHQNILKTKCSFPGCHDGTFEPDFRTVQSSWSTLVYARIVKNTADSAYSFRAVPGDTSTSILWRRITRGNAQLQQMPATGAILSVEEQANIRDWILNGARDMFGNVGILPNSQPTYGGFVCYDMSFNRLDNNRLGGVSYNPFIVPNGLAQIQFGLLATDDSTAVQNLIYKLKFSDDKDDFTGASTVTATWNAIFGLHIAVVNTNLWATGDTVFFRAYINDGDHASDLEFPRYEMLDVYKTYHAMYFNP